MLFLALFLCTVIFHMLSHIPLARLCHLHKRLSYSGLDEENDNYNSVNERTYREKNKCYFFGFIAKTSVSQPVCRVTLICCEI